MPVSEGAKRGRHPYARNSAFRPRGKNAQTYVPQTGQELAQVSYWISTGQTQVQLTSTTAVNFADQVMALGTPWTGFTSTSLDITFTVPPSGAVLVRLETIMQISSSNHKCDWLLYDVGAAAAVTNSEMTIADAGQRERASYAKRITGLTPGASKTYRWQILSVDGTQVNFQSGATAGPHRMQVFAA